MSKIRKIVVSIIFVLTVISICPASIKASETKTVAVVSEKSKTIKTRQKIRKVQKISKNKNFTVKKTGSYCFKISKSDINKQQTVKVTYVNGKSQKFNIKTEIDYLEKIVSDLKPLLADPDRGLPIAIAQWEKILQKKENKKYLYKIDYIEWDKDFSCGSLVNAHSFEKAMKMYTPSEKKSFILEAYFRARMEYNLVSDDCSYFYNRGSNSFFKQLYKGTFQGVCCDGACMAYDICKKLRIKAKYIESKDHAWCATQVTDSSGVNYWQGIYTTSYGLNLTNGINKIKGDPSDLQIRNNLYSAHTYRSVLI